MLIDRILNGIGITPRKATANIILIANAFIWYLCAFGVLKNVMADLKLQYFEFLVIWSANFGGAALSALVGASLSSKVRSRTTFLLSWTLAGILSSFALIFVDVTNPSTILVASCLLGVSFGIGMPACMGYFTDTTVVENRTQLAGLILLAGFAGTFVLVGILGVGNIFIAALVLAAWRALGLVFFALAEHKDDGSQKKRNVSYLSIISQRSFLTYLIPWVMFALVDSFGISLQFKILDQTTADILLVCESVLVGAFAVIAGFLAGFLGRKRMAISGFVIVGLGYAVLGIFPMNVVSWYFSTVVDSIAWGIFYVIFFISIWGDLAYGRSSEKFYALGGLPYLLSNFLRITFGSSVAEAIPAYAIFSFAAFFLFLAIIPLISAPETLPEKSTRDRELKRYLEKAKKTKEKYT
jgi:MFS family permease